MILLLALACADPAPPAAPPPDPCLEAWEELAAARDALQQQVEQIKAPDRERFVAACRILPEEVRPCVAMSRRLTDPSCRERLEGVPRDTREAFDEALSASSAP